RNNTFLSDRKAEDLSDLAERNAQRHSVQKPNQNGFREEVSQRAQTQKSGENTKNASQESESHGKGDMQVRIAGGQGTHCRCHDGARSSIRTDDQLAGSSEERIREQRKDARVQSKLRPESGELCIGDADWQC